MLDAIDQAAFRDAFPQFIARLRPSVAQRLMQWCSRSDFPAGRIVFRDGLVTDGVYFVLSGTADVSVEKDGRSIALGQIGKGQLFGEIAALSHHGTAQCTFKANSRITAVRLAYLPLEDLLAAEDTGPALLDLFIMTLASRLSADAWAA